MTNAYAYTRVCANRRVGIWHILIYAYVHTQWLFVSLGANVMSDVMTKSILFMINTSNCLTQQSSSVRLVHCEGIIIFFILIGVVGPPFDKKVDFSFFCILFFFRKSINIPGEHEEINSTKRKKETKRIIAHKLRFVDCLFFAWVSNEPCNLERHAKHHCSSSNRSTVTTCVCRVK